MPGLLVKSGNSLTDPEKEPAGDGGSGGGGGRLGLEIALSRTEIAPGARWWQPPVQPCVRLLKVMNESRDEDRAACLHAVASFCVPSQLWLRAADVKIGDGSKTDWHGFVGGEGGFVHLTPRVMGLNSSVLIISLTTCTRNVFLFFFFSNSVNRFIKKNIKTLQNLRKPSKPSSKTTKLEARIGVTCERTDLAHRWAVSTPEQPDVASQRKVVQAGGLDVVTAHVVDASAPPMIRGEAARALWRGSLQITNTRVIPTTFKKNKTRGGGFASLLCCIYTQVQVVI